MENWYVIQVRTRNEEKIKNYCEEMISDDVLHSCFIPRFRKMKKIRGEWNEVEEILFSGYVFLVSSCPEELFMQLKKIPDLTKMLGRDLDYFYTLYEDEVNFLKSFIDSEYVVNVSSGLIENDIIKITSGPLVGKEGMIKKIDRHKRLAVVEVELFGKITQAKVGLEIVSKT